METSTPSVTATPVTNKNLRRQTLLRNAVEVSPLRRRSIIQTPVSLVEKCDDESERSSRRSVVDIQRRLSSISHNSSLNDSYKFLGEKDMNDHLHVCEKLFTENRITTKNAWKLRIIDMLKYMAQKVNSDILKVASTSLDISAKVYGIRVDDIHSDALKLASSMARTVTKELPPDGDGDDDASADKENAAVKKKKKRRKLQSGEKNTILETTKAFQDRLQKLQSVLFSIKTNADSSAVDNLFTIVLKMDNSGYKFMVLSNEKVWATSPDPLVKDADDPNRKQNPITIEPLQNVNLCTPFNDFEVDEWDPEEEEKQLAVEKTIYSQRQEEVVFDEDGIPIPELDGSVHDMFVNNQDADDPMDADDDIQSIHEEILPQIRGEIAKIVNLRPEDPTLQRSEYSYNSVINMHSGKFIDQIWAGPSHWKLKFLRRSSTRFSGQVVNEIKHQKRGRRKVQPQMIDFDEEYEEFDMSKKFIIKKKPPTVDFHKITLPIPDPSCIKLMQHINELMCKPGVCPKKKKVAAENQVDYEVSAYKYENPNDSLYCSQQNADDDNGGDVDCPFDDNQDAVVEEHILGQQQEFIGDNLIDAPETVPKSYIPYAMKAKKMDMKKLKAAVWQILTESNRATSLSDNHQQRSGKVIPTTFSKMYKQLPDLLSDEMRLNLTCSLAFVALLHLCNEENLQLKQHCCYTDFDIRGPSK